MNRPYPIRPYPERPGPASTLFDGLFLNQVKDVNLKLVHVMSIGFESFVSNFEYKKVDFAFKVFLVMLDFRSLFYTSFAEYSRVTFQRQKD